MGQSFELFQYPSGNVVRSFGQDISRIPVTRISVLELDITTGQHVYAAVVLDLLGRCTSIQKLSMMLDLCQVIIPFVCYICL